MLLGLIPFRIVLAWRMARCQTLSRSMGGRVREREREREQERDGDGNGDELGLELDLAGEGDGPDVLHAVEHGPVEVEHQHVLVLLVEVEGEPGDQPTVAV